jgi:hypothetical protein
MPPSDAVRVSDVSRVTSLRERLGRAASSLKLIGFISAVEVTMEVSDYVSAWIAALLGILLFCSAFPLGTRLRSGQTWAAGVIALWLIPFGIWSFRVLWRSVSNGLGFYSVLGNLIINLPVYFAVRGLLELRAHKTRPAETPGMFEPLTLNPWEDGAHGSRKHPKFLNKKSLRAYLFVLSAPFVLLFMMASSLNRPEPSTSDPFELAGRRTADVFMSVLVWLLMIYLYRRGRRHALLPGNELLKRDQRGVVLYLRSFLDDRAIRIRARPTDGRIFPERLMKISFEELVTDHLWRYGPVVAIGDPRARDKLVPLGAARDFESDAWQQKAADLMRRASIIVAVAGAAEGFLWELNSITNMKLESRLVLLLPPLKTRQLAARWDAIVQRVTELKLPSNLDLKRARAVIFRDDAVVVITADKRNDWTYETVLDNAALLILPAQESRP